MPEIQERKATTIEKTMSNVCGSRLRIAWYADEPINEPTHASKKSTAAELAPGYDLEWA
jgi:hypothetical protein